MPCTEDVVTASHRPVLPLQAYLLVDGIFKAAQGNGGSGEPTPTEATVRSAIDLIAEVPFRLLGEPDVDPFYGEIHLSWTHGSKQIVLMCFPNRTPLIHHYLRAPGAASVHDIEEASVDRVAYWLGWLRA